MDVKWTHSFSVMGERQHQEDDSFSWKADTYFFAAVLDGHSGSAGEGVTSGQRVVARVKREISSIMPLLRHVEDRGEQLNLLFRTIDAKIVEDGGCVVSGFVLDNRKITLFNIGDCSYVLFGVKANGDWHELAHSEIHNPASFLELQRMIAVALSGLGVALPDPRRLTHAARVLRRNMDAEESGGDPLPEGGNDPYLQAVREVRKILVFKNSVWRLSVNEGSTLAPSRAIGDRKHKRNDGRPEYLSCQPHSVSVPYSKSGENVVVEGEGFRSLMAVIYSDGVVGPGGIMDDYKKLESALKSRHNAEDILTQGRARDNATLSIFSLGY